MAILKAGNTEVDIRFHKLCPQGGFEYSFNPRIDGIPLVSPSANKEWCQDGVYICCDPFSKDSLIPFFEHLLEDLENRKWEAVEPPIIEIRAETWKAGRLQKKAYREEKMVWVTDDEDELKQVPYEEITDMFAPLIDMYVDLYIVICPEFFRGERSSGENGHVCMYFTVLTDTIQNFLEELKAEYEALQKAC